MPCELYDVCPVKENKRYEQYSVSRMEELANYGNSVVDLNELQSLQNKIHELKKQYDQAVTDPRSKTENLCRTCTYRQ